MALQRKKTPDLPADIKEALRVGFNKSIGHNGRTFMEWLRNRPREDWEDWKDGFCRGTPSQLTKLQLCVHLAEYLEELDETEEVDEDQEGHVTAVFTAEFLIFDLTCHTPLRYNPCLSHWVNTAAKIQQQLPMDLIASPWKVRLGLIRLALSSPGVEDGAQRKPGIIEKCTPEELCEVFIETNPQMINLVPAVKMMEQQGLPLSNTIRDYLVIAGLRMPERQQAVTAVNVHQIQLQTASPGVQDDFFKNLLGRATEDVHHKRAINQASNASPLPSGLPPPNEETTTQTKGKAPVPQLFPITSRSSLDAIRQALELDPESTSHALSRLPLDLASLDLLTKILDSNILANFAPLLESTTITREYIQHCLRIIERTGNTFSPTSDSGFDEQQDDGPRGKEEQIRGVKLLVMFMKNLLGKDKLPVPELRFDIEEICVRYLWISEVREFRKLMGGDGLIIPDELGQGDLAVGG